MGSRNLASVFYPTAAQKTPTIYPAINVKASSTAKCFVIGNCHSLVRLTWENFLVSEYTTQPKERERERERVENTDPAEGTDLDGIDL